jgi:hypothetical protein
MVDTRRTKLKGQEKQGLQTNTRWATVRRYPKQVFLWIVAMAKTRSAQFLFEGTPPGTDKSAVIKLRFAGRPFTFQQQTQSDIRMLTC